jgi:prepilin-type N-terminal cleavage/methylation domain-containing protein
MPPRNSHRRTKQGFTLIEAVIVIAIMAILAGAAVPLMVQALTGQRTQKTRDLVRTAYEALVGARDHSVPNLVTDVGFDPPLSPATMNDLRILTTRTPPGGWPTGVVPPQAPVAAAGFTWGWNGPYWTSPILPLAGTNGLPADGADGVFGTADDVVYPPPSLVPPGPPLPPAMARIYVLVVRDLPSTGPVTSATFSIQVTDRFQQQLLLRTRTPVSNPPSPFTWAASGSLTTAFLDVQPGPVYIQITSLAAGDQSQVVTLAPGEMSRVVAFRWNN